MHPHGPETVFAVVDAPFVQGKFELPGFALIQKDGGEKQADRILLNAAEILLHHGFFAAGGIMLRDPAKHPGDHSVKVVRMLRVEFGSLQPLGAELLYRPDDLGILLLPDVVQHSDAPVKNHLTAVCQKVRIQPVIDHIIHKPLGQIGEDLFVQLAVGVLKVQKLPIAVQGIRRADLVEQLINIEKGEGQGGFADISFAQLCTPGKVSPKLLVREGLVGGKIAHNIAVEGIVIFIVGQKLGLFYENGFPGLPGFSRGVFQRAGGTDRGRHTLRAAFRTGLDDLIPEDVAVKPVRGFSHPVRIRNGATSFGQMFEIIIYQKGGPVKGTPQKSDEQRLFSPEASVPRKKSPWRAATSALHGDWDVRAGTPGSWR